MTINLKLRSKFEEIKEELENDRTHEDQELKRVHDEFHEMLDQNVKALEYCIKEKDEQMHKKFDAQVMGDL